MVGNAAPALYSLPKSISQTRSATASVSASVSATDSAAVSASPAACNRSHAKQLLFCDVHSVQKSNDRLEVYGAAALLLPLFFFFLPIFGVFLVSSVALALFASLNASRRLSRSHSPDGPGQSHLERFEIMSRFYRISFCFLRTPIFCFSFFLLLLLHLLAASN